MLSDIDGIAKKLGTKKTTVSNKKVVDYVTTSGYKIRFKESLKTGAGKTPDAKTTAVSLNGDTRPTPMVPVELMTTEISFDITQTANSNLLVNGLTYYYQPLGEF